MKRKGDLFDTLISSKNINLAIDEVNKTHRYYPRHKLNKKVKWIEDTRQERVKELRQIILDGFEPAPVKTKRIWDKSAGKERVINEPKLWPDQYIHHIFIQTIQPTLLKYMDPFCCGSIKGRGLHYGVKAIQHWMKSTDDSVDYCLEADIYHYYESIKTEQVMLRLKHLIKDRYVLDLANRIMKDGVLIGVYSSQWFANTILQPLDKIIRESGLCTHYIRYMDNFTIFSNNKENLHKLNELIQIWLENHELKLKDNWQIFNTNVRLPAALGYRYGRGYTIPKKRNLLRLKRGLKTYYYKVEHNKYIPPKLAYSNVSRLGQLKHCNHNKIFEQIYKPKTQKELKTIIRKQSKIMQIKIDKEKQETPVDTTGVSYVYN